VVELRGIVKRFPGVLANDHADLSLKPGEVHALLGENGAGKTTLMCVLAGIYRPDAGAIVMDGSEVAFRSPRHAIEAGIGMVHQHFRLVQPFTVAENVLLGTDGGFRLSRGELEARVGKLADTYAMDVKPSARVWQLSVGEQQRVEILKALWRNARVLVLDEPTAVLTPQEAERLFATLRQMAAEGRNVVFISHKLEEVLAVSDRITVLRAGRRVDTVARADATKEHLARLMVGRDVVLRVRRTGPSPSGASGPFLRVSAVTAHSDVGLEALRGVDLEIRSGEILGIAGVAGNGQRELAEVVAGLRPVRSGSVELGDADITRASPAERISGGLAYVPEDRLGTGMVSSMDCTSNVLLKRAGRGRFARGLLDMRAAEGLTKGLTRDFDVKTASVRSPVGLLSGGNIQKLLLARELSSRPRALVAAQPTAGLDVGATEAIHGMLLDQRAKGVAILLISEDLDELLAIADRVAVMYEGRIMGIVDASGAEREEVGLMMAGSSRPSEASS
jgi:general nucleoside transport system ATP-binding protein